MKLDGNILINTLLIFSMISCNYPNNKNGYIKKPLKYYKDDKLFRGDGYYKNDTLEVAVCFNENRDTILIDTLRNDKLNGLSREFHSNGSIKKIGKYYNDSKYGIWRQYYETGELRNYEFWGSRDDQFYYSKNYSKTGELLRFKLPLQYSHDIKDSVFYVGKSYKVYIDLLHSEFDRVLSLGIIDENQNLGIEPDTFVYDGPGIAIEINPTKAGVDTIRGTFTEYSMEDWEKTKKEPEFVPEQKFKYPIEIKNYH